MRILLVEDDPSLCLIMEAFLKREGHEVDHAASRDRANQLLDENKYDIAIIDLVLVMSTGDTVAQKAYLKGVGVIVMTAAEEKYTDDLVETLRINGCKISCLLKKPFPLQMLKVAINEAYVKKEVREGKEGCADVPDGPPTPPPVSND